MLTCLVPVLFTFYIQGVLKFKKNLAPKGLIRKGGGVGVGVSRGYEMVMSCLNIFINFFSGEISPLCSIINRMYVYTGLFEMIVGILTTCHAKYT